jgi:hypothetical protein
MDEYSHYDSNTNVDNKRVCKVISFDTAYSDYLLIKKGTYKMIIKLVKNKPKTGQFVASWIHNKNLWNHTFKYINGELHIYDNGGDSKGDSWNPYTFTLNKNIKRTLKYYIYK